jgi:hypothetical protein
MSHLGAFARFWYDFIIGDDWRVALGAVGAIVATFVAAHAGADWWWLLPVAITALLTISVRHAARSDHGAPPVQSP